jgi:predicted HD superfamily hydrolase involved in NAD metabolism
MDYAELSCVLARRVLAEGPDAILSPRRREHSRNVAELAARLCDRASIDPERGRAAGLAHDMCKEFPHAELSSLAAAFPGAAPGSSLLGVKAMHGPAAAVLLARDYGVDDAEFLDAVAYHTLGRPGMASLEIAVYCADKLEPGRKRIDSAWRERCLSLPLPLMLPEVVASVIRWLKEQDLAVAPETIVLYESLNRRIPTV